MDRLYESGMGEAWSGSVPAEQTGQWMALGLMTAGVLAVALAESSIQQAVRSPTA